MEDNNGLAGNWLSERRVTFLINQSKRLRYRGSAGTGNWCPREVLRGVGLSRFTESN